MSTAEWIALPAMIVAVLTILVVGYKGMKVFFRFDRALPTLFSIAEEFRNNGGSTLRDRLDSQATKIDKLGEKVDDQRVRTEIRFARLEAILQHPKH